jgi:mitotic spindle assembly checkpoint protein MAD2B
VNIYSPDTFFPAAKYNLLVHQSRHCGVCDYINCATTAVHQEILSETVKRIKVVTFVQDSSREQFVFDITQLSQHSSETTVKAADKEQKTLSVDAEQQLRGVLSKLKDHCNLLEPSDEEKTFRIIIEQDGRSTLGSMNEQRWEVIPNTCADVSHSKEFASNMVNIRSVKAGGLVFPLWYKSALTPPHPSTYTASQPLVPDGSTSSSSSDLYGTFPSTQTGLDE